MIKILWFTLFTALAFSTSSCEGPLFDDQKSLLAVKQQGTLVVLTTNRPLTFQKTGSISEGLEKELLQNFADTYNLRLQFIIKKSRSEVIEDLSNGRGDIAIDRFFEGDQDIAAINALHGPAIDVANTALFCNKRLKLKSIMDLSTQSLSAPKNMHQKIRQFFPSVRLEDNSSAIEVTASKIQSESLDCAILDGLEAQWTIRSYLQVAYVQDLRIDRPVIWLLGNNQIDLQKLLASWIRIVSRDDELMRIQDHYRGITIGLSTADIRKFRKSLSTDLVIFRKMFIDSGLEHELDWRLIASVAYQESHWNPNARSFTGVRGLMQLTEDTAAHVGIEDRNDPAQSIWGGSYYLRSLMDQMPNYISKRDRVALTLAAYNSGLGHLKDVQTLATERGLNPWSWRHLKRLYPLLEDESIAADLPMGGARGSETISFVERVLSYYNLFNSY